MNPAPAISACILTSMAMLLAPGARAVPAQVPAPPQARAVTAAEMTSFHAYYQQRFPGLAPAKPVFRITRPGPNSAWTIFATVDSQPQRGLRALCRMNRTDFSFAGRWSSALTTRPHAWLERPACTKRAQAIELLQQMPDIDAVSLLERQTVLLQSARILLGGNTGCASQRAFQFALHQLDVGRAGPNPEVMAGLVFKSDHNTLATVWAKRNGLDYIAWNVSCT